MFEVRIMFLFVRIRDFTTSFGIKELSYNPMRPFVSQLIPGCSFSELFTLNKEKEKKGREGGRREGNFPNAAKQNQLEVK